MHGAVDGDDVKPSVVVIVEKHRAESREGDARCRDPRLDAAILEIACAAVDEQRALLARQVGQEDILGAVAVEVSDVHSHPRLGDAVRVDRAAA